MVNISGNNIALILDKKSVDSKDPKVKEQLIEKLQEFIPRNRVTSLIRNTYKISVDELAICSRVLEVSMDDLVVLEEIKSTAA